MVYINYLTVIHYIGHGEKKTSNWCLKMVLSPSRISLVHYGLLQRKQLTIHSDCGNWIQDYVNTLDDLGIPSCGHHTREKLQTL